MNDIMSVCLTFNRLCGLGGVMPQKIPNYLNC